MGPDSSRPDRSQSVQSDGGLPTETGEMEVYTTVRGAMKDALLEVIGLLLQLGLGLALVFLGVQTLFRSVYLVDVIFGVLILVAGILIAAPVLKLVQPLRF